MSLVVDVVLAEPTGFGIAGPTKGCKLGTEQTQKLQVGMVVTAQGGPCQGIVGTACVPIDWPEQEVKIVEEDCSPSVKSITYRQLPAARQMVVNMPFIPANQDCRAVLTFEIHRHALLAPEDTSIFVLPNTKKLKSDTRIYLGPSPMIEVNNAKIKALVKEAMAGKETAWAKVEAIFDAVRSKVEQRDGGPFKSAAVALKDGYGATEDICSLFISACREADVPARMVWVVGHLYTEFYLEDAEGQGYWFPAQPAGNREFGAISEMRPILHKGDSFQTPEKPREKQRFLSEYLTGAGGKPSCRFIREMVN